MLARKENQSNKLVVAVRDEFRRIRKEIDRSEAETIKYIESLAFTEEEKTL